MIQMLDRISSYVGEAFESAGYDGKLGRVTVSNRPDLCEYQCNGAMAGAKQYHKAPLEIAQDVAGVLDGCDAFESVEAVRPGFLNLKLSEDFLAGFLEEMAEDERLGVPEGQIDVSDECTFCQHDKYWSHRYTKGRRGIQAAGIVL